MNATGRQGQGCLMAQTRNLNRNQQNAQDELGRVHPADWNKQTKMQ